MNGWVKTGLLILAVSGTTTFVSRAADEALPPRTIYDLEERQAVALERIAAALESLRDERVILAGDSNVAAAVDRLNRTIRGSVFDLPEE